MIAWQLDLQLHVQSVPITKVVCSNPGDGEMYPIQHNVIKVVNDLRQFGGFLRVFRLFGDYVNRIYSIECEIKDTKDTHSSVS